MPSYIEKRRRVWYAVLDVPKDLREHYGKKRLLRSLKTESKTEAERLVLPLVSLWKNDFAAVRGGGIQQIEVLALEHAKTIAGADDDELAEIYDELAQEEAQHISETDRDRANAYYELAKGQSVPFDWELDGWLASRDLTQKTADLYRSALNVVKGDFPYTHLIDRRKVKAWVGKKLVEDGLSRATVGRYVSAAKGYWEYLDGRGHIHSDTNPFENVLPSVKQKVKGSKVDKRRPFSASQVVAVRAAAIAKNDHQLSDLIALGMWTGCRIEELCSLRTSDVEENCFTVTDAKSEAGNRVVPIHPKLASTLNRLLASSGDGFVLAGLDADTYGKRSNAIGKRFGRLKKNLGYGKDYVFHSIRKTVTTQLENAGVPEGVSADILGHEKGTITYGLYSGGNSLAVKREAIMKLNYPGW